MQDTLERIRETYADSITRSYSERGCRLRLDGIRPEELATIHGSRYQENRGHTGRLCDRIVFCRDNGIVVAAVELKGGRNIRMSHAIDQIQGGLRIAATILARRRVSDWVPLLLYNGRMTSSDTTILRTRTVEFQGERKIIVKRNCGSQLAAVLPD